MKIYSVTLKKHLTKVGQVINNAGLTKKHYTHSQALNRAFFMPKNHQKGVLTLPFWNNLSMKNQVHILNMDGLKHGIQYPIYWGIYASRIVRFSDTRPPVIKAGGLTKKHYGGQTMPLNTSNGGYIRQIQAVATLNGIQAASTKHRQTQAINGLFSSLASLKQFIHKQGINPSLVNWRVA